MCLCALCVPIFQCKLPTELDFCWNKRAHKQIQKHGKNVVFSVLFFLFPATVVKKEWRRCSEYIHIVPCDHSELFPCVSIIILLVLSILYNPFVPLFSSFVNPFFVCCCAQSLSSFSCSHLIFISRNFKWSSLATLLLPYTGIFDHVDKEAKIGEALTFSFLQWNSHRGWVNDSLFTATMNLKKVKKMRST